MGDTSDGNACLNVLVIGSAGHVGSILRPALEEAHDLHHLDLKPVPGAEDRTTVASVTDEDAVREAVAGKDAVVYLAMGQFFPEVDTQSMFDVNVQGLYRVARQAMKAGVQRFVHASSLGVYNLRQASLPLDESAEPDNWGTYGLSKRLGERVLETAGQQQPDATITALRLMHPLTEDQWNAYQSGELDKFHDRSPTGPLDMQRLFLAALALSRPGVHIVQTSGDTTGEHYPNHGAHELLGWWPKGE